MDGEKLGLDWIPYGDLSGLVGTLLFSVGVEWMDTIKKPFRIPRAGFVRVGFQCCIVY